MAWKKIGETAHSVVEGIREVNKYDPDYFGRESTGRQW